jgi:hypothetical protein
MIFLITAYLSSPLARLFYIANEYMHYTGDAEMTFIVHAADSKMSVDEVVARVVEGMTGTELRNESSQVTSVLSRNTMDGIGSFATFGCIMAKVLTSWSLLYFLQLNSTLGKFVIGFQGMMMALVQFTSIFTVIFLSFSVAFADVFALSCSRKDFSTFAKGLYSTMLMILNMFDFGGYEKMNAIFAVKLPHVIFIMIVPILLINFLIATMSNKHSAMTDYGDVIHRLHRLEVSLTAGERIG